MKTMQRLRLAWRVMTQKPGNLMHNAERELGLDMDIELRELLLVFSSQGHSGGSAGVITNMLEKLLRYEPLSPLTGEADEWSEVIPGTFQNKRCSRIFKMADLFNGQAYDLNGIVWQDERGGFTNSESCLPIVFPYTPKIEYRPAPAAST